MKLDAYSKKVKNKIAGENYVMSSFFLAIYCMDDRIKEGNKIGKFRTHARDDKLMQSSGRQA
jgi:hypothetical protein